MRAVLITPPTTDVVTTAEVRTMLGLASSEPSDAMLEAMIGAVVGTLDAASDGWLGRALAQQTWELRLAGFPPCPITLPFPPLVSLTSVKYDDASGVEQTAVADVDFRLFSGVPGKARIEPVYGGSWPAARCDDEAVRIRFVAGYADGAVPQPIKAAIALGVRSLMSTGAKDLHLSRDEVPGVIVQQYVVSEAAAKAIENAIGSLLGTFRVYG